ncbi:tRNA pseudouridine(55) synthase TruB [Methylocapsa sp. S129]|uniref:tRNA pseudouridine(55) synthase TruB n=1 Tax=Methylocapsa sp. S129 TaxID=1641869 RepID=UPI00131D85F1|nr:tRNA pseudouridine(55) synthase TruB [Methylocapsa sp. S129]
MSDAMIEEAPARPKAEKREQRRSTRVEVNGWVCLDKPIGLTSTQAVAQLKYLFNAKKAGHAGTLDPLASGVLPIAFGEATKTVPIVQDGVKIYRFGVKWGEETDTDDAEGRVIAASELRPDPAAISAQLPRFIGVISQVPPIYSAIKIAGERAYDLAREGAALVMAPREIVVHRLELISSEPGLAIFEAECGKGTYVRAIARDLGRLLGCYGHVVLLRRTRVGPFWSEGAVTPDSLGEAPDLVRAMLPVEAGLRELPNIALDRDGAAILRRGQKLLLRGSHAPHDGPAYASCFGAPIAFGVVEAGYFVSTRVFNLPG